ncbi:MAG: ferrous iron transport protein A [Leptolyngbya sp. SIO1D8]|nr:ferrous iron transport protein A [Leptolyngbya sp. SIO1D8]
MSGESFDIPFGEITFIGGNVDLEPPLISAQEPASSLTPGGARLPLAMTSVGDRVWVVHLRGGRRFVRRLTDVGIIQGSEITVISRTQSGSVIVALQECRIGLGAGMAHQVLVTSVQPKTTPATPSQQPTQSVSGEHTMPATLHLGALAVGQSGCILGYEKENRAYREKLLSMGLTPGTHFTLTRQAPMGDPIEIEVRGFKLSLRKGEAAALKVKTLTPEEVCHD